MSDKQKLPIKGILVAHGVDHYLHDPAKPANYFIQIRQDDGALAERWSKNLETVIKDSGMQRGDEIILSELGREPMQVGDKTFNKILWDLQKYEPQQNLTNAIEHDTLRQQEKEALAEQATRHTPSKTPSKLAPIVHDPYSFASTLPSNIKNNYVAIVKNRLLSDEKINYYDKNDPDKINIAFEDRKSSLNTSRQDDRTIYAMLDLAQSKGWSAIKLKGTEEFKQKAWLEASLRGIETKGYTPTEQDQAELIAKQQERSTNQVVMTAQKSPEAISSQEKSPIPEMMREDLDKQELSQHRHNETSPTTIPQTDQSDQQTTPTQDSEAKTINTAFNQQLQALIDGKLNQSHIFQLGKPSEILLSTGFPDKPIELKASKLWEKSQADWHQFALDSAKDLPQALQAPLAVFAYGDKNKSQNVIGEIEHAGKKIVVGVHFNQTQDGIDVNSVRGFFPKDNHEWLNWIAQNKALYLDKEKVQTLIAQQRTNLADVSYLNLNLVESLVKNFDNVKKNNQLDNNEKSPIPEMTRTDQDKQGSTQHRSNEVTSAITQSAPEEQTPYNLENPANNQAYLDKIGKDFAGVQAANISDSFDKTRAYANAFVSKGSNQKELVNFHNGYKAIISSNNLDKMLSNKAHQKSDGLHLHLTAVANADKLFENAVFGWEHGDKDEQSGNQIHRAIAPLKIDNQVYLTKLTIKEIPRGQGSRFYSIEAVEVEQEKSPIPEMMREDLDKQELSQHRHNGALIDSIVQKAQEYNRQNQQQTNKTTTIYEKLQESNDTQVYLNKIGVNFDGANAERQALSFDEARTNARTFTGKTLTSLHGGITAILSNKNLDKMLSGKAHEKSVDLKTHLIAVSNADKLFENAVFAWQSAHKTQSPDIEAVHRALAPMKIYDRVYLAKLTLKELTREQGNRIYSIEAIDVDNEKSPIPEMTEEYSKSVTPHRLNEALIDSIVQKAQEYNRQNQVQAPNTQQRTNLAEVSATSLNPNATISQATHQNPVLSQKTTAEIKSDIRQLFQNGYKNGSIKSRDELVAVLKKHGYTIKENAKSLRVSLGVNAAVNLRGEAFSKGYDAIKSLVQRLDLDALKQTHPTLKNSDLVHISAYKNKLFDDHATAPNPKKLQAALVQLEHSVKQIAAGKALSLPDLPINEIKPDIGVRTTDNHHKSRQL